jgi:HK97 family phage major capsid protein
MADEKELLEKVKTEAQGAIESFKNEYKEIATKAAEGKMSKVDVDKALTELETKSQAFTNEQLKVVNEELLKVKSELANAIGKLKAIEEKPQPTGKSERSGFGSILRKSLEDANLIEEKILDPITGKKAVVIKNWDRADLKVQTKAAINMTTALTLLPGATPGTNIGYLTDYSKMPDVLINLTKDMHVVNFLPTDPITGDYMGVLVEHTYFDGAAVTTEGNSPVASSIKFKTIEFKVLDYAAKVRVHKNMLRDMPRLESKLNRIVPDSILGALDSAVFSTTGDNSATAWGMYYAGNYVAFSETGLGTVPLADLVDLIGKMVLQANNADQDVNTVILHPSLLNGLRHGKDELGNSVQNRNIIFDNNGNVVSIWGLMVRTTKKQTTGRVTVMWDQAVEIGILEDVTMEIGTDGNDFSEGYRTIIFNMRAAFGVGKPGAIFLSVDPDGDIAKITAV